MYAKCVSDNKIVTLGVYKILGLSSFPVLSWYPCKILLCSYQRLVLVMNLS